MNWRSPTKKSLDAGCHNLLSFVNGIHHLTVVRDVPSSSFSSCHPAHNLTRAHLNSAKAYLPRLRENGGEVKRKELERS